MSDVASKRVLTRDEIRERAGDRWFSMSDLETDSSLHRATIYRQIQRGNLPEGAPVGAQRVVWFERDVRAWKELMLEAVD